MLNSQLVSAKDVHGNELKGAALLGMGGTGVGGGSAASGMREQAYKLLTLRSRILDHDLD